MINLFEPQVGAQALEELSKVFESKWLGRRTLVGEFESNLADFLGCNRSQLSTISSCSDAIFGIFEYMKWDVGSEILIPSICFPAIPNAIKANNLTIVPVDVEAETGNISLQDLAKKVTKKTKAAFVTDYGGIPVEIEKLRDILGPDIFIFEDAACALGSKHNNTSVGLKADFTCWSLDAMKLITCGEGGVFFTQSAEFTNKLREYFYLGLPADEKSGLDKSKNAGMWWEYQLECAGRRSIFTNINAAIGMSQLRNVHNLLNRRAEIRSFYMDSFKNIEELSVSPQTGSDSDYSNYFFTVRTNKRDELATHLKRNGIYSTFRYYPIHEIKLFNLEKHILPGTKLFAETALNIPIHNGLTDEQINHIATQVKSFFGKIN